VSISDFAKKPEPEPTKDSTPVGLKLSDPDVKPTEPALVVEQPIVTPNIVTPTIGLIVTEPAPAVNRQAILDDIMGKIPDKIGTHSKLKMVIYGDPGSMKSSCAATAPNNLIADLEDGLISAKFSPHGVAEQVKPYPWNGFEEYSNLVGALIEDVPELAWVETHTIDTFSEVHKRALAEIVERDWRKRPGSVNRYVAETEHHVENNERMLRMIRALKEMDRNLILLTHATTVEPKNKPAKTYPDFSEKLANKIEAMMDVVAYAEKKYIQQEDGTKRLCMILKVEADEGVHCKTRFPLPAEMINPTMAQILNAWEESKAL
jgi:hypothetical protein